MISIEQVRALEERVEKAVAYIASLRSENISLADRLERTEAAYAAATGRLAEASDRIATAEALAESNASKAAEAFVRIVELEAAAEASKHDQLRIEEGIIHALEKLDAFEDLVLRVDAVAAPLRTSAVEQGSVVHHAEHSDLATVTDARGVKLDFDSDSPVKAEQQAAKPVATEVFADELSLEELEAMTAPTQASDRIESNSLVVEHHETDPIVSSGSLPSPVVLAPAILDDSDDGYSLPNESVPIADPVMASPQTHLGHRDVSTESKPSAEPRPRISPIAPPQAIPSQAIPTASVSVKTENELDIF